LRQVHSEIGALPNGRSAIVVGDFADPDSARQAARHVAALSLPVAGVHNNAGIMQLTDGAVNNRGWDLTYATNHLGPFAFTEELIPHLADGTRVLFTVSGVEDPERKPAVIAGFRGGRYISAEASARGEFEPGGSTRPGYDAYATSKQCNLATVFALAREFPRLRINAVEPGFNPGTRLGRDASAFLQFISRRVMSPLAPLIKYWSTPKTAGRVISKLLTTDTDDTGVYYDERGRPMQASRRVSDPAFHDRVVAETRDFLAKASRGAQ
jgi:NAD(P)-dependent dehydrogenase (short-subunit alcohol dehydrogenase family)